MTLEAILFDMDGVLVDSEVYWKQSRIEFARALGKEWTDADHRVAMGRNTREWAAVMQERLRIDWSIEDIIHDVKRRVVAHYDERLPLLPNAIEAVHLAASRYRVGLASGSPTDIIQHVMKLTGLDQVFEVIIYADDFTNGKPAPDVYLAAAAQLGVAPKRCVGIEDSINGVCSLKAAGMGVIAVPSPDFPLPQDILDMADYVLPSLVEFTPAFLDQLERTI